MTREENELWTVLKTLEWTTSYFASRNIEGPRPSAEILLAHVLNLRRIDLYLRYDLPLSKEELTRFKPLVLRRAAGEPVAYITGKREFHSIDLHVSKDVLIPRPETEFLVDAAIDFLSQSSRQGKKCHVIDLGTGSGAIIIGVAVNHSAHEFFACDISPQALKIAKTNAKNNRMGEKIRFFASDWFDAVSSQTARFDLILSNPPYIRTNDIRDLQIEVSKYEPKLALDGNRDGLFAIRKLVRSAHKFLAPDGKVLMEIGHDQRKDVENIVSEEGVYGTPVFIRDFGNVDRIAGFSLK